MAQVHLRYVNDQPNATILHGWIDFLPTNSVFLLHFFPIVAQMFLNTGRALSRETANQHLKAGLRSKPA